MLPVKSGGVLSAVQVTVLDIVDVLLHPSIAVNVLVCERKHPLLPTLPSVELIVGVEHPSFAVAVPNAASTAVPFGLQPSSTLL